MTESAVASAHNRPRRHAIRRGAAAPWICTCVLLVGILGDRWLLREPSSDPAPYHARVKEEAARIPHYFDDWLGDDVPVPQAAVQMLQPNVLFSRRYQQMSTGRYVTVLLVQCTDARDLQGHYPPVCYPGQGWSLVSSEPRDWTSGGRTIQGMRYNFKTSDQGRFNETTIDNFMLLPGGGTARNMDEVRQAAADRRRRFFGAAQVQIVYGPDYAESDRIAVLHTFVGALSPTINRIGQRVGEEQP
jgi:hypothetical protein